MKEQTVIPGGDPYVADTLIAEREPEAPPFDPEHQPPNLMFPPGPRGNTMASRGATSPGAATESTDKIARIVDERAAEVLNRFDVTFSRGEDDIRIDAENNDERFGIEIVRRALEVPLRQIVENAGEDGSVIVGKVLETEEYAWGFDAETGGFKNLIAAGIIDPTKVVRTALQDAAGVAGLLITTEAMIAEKPEKKASLEAVPDGKGGMDY
jgi:hypothetical protein